MRRWLLMLALFGVSCGGNTPVNVTPPTTLPPPPAPPRVVSEGAQPLEVEFIGRTQFNITLAGRLDATVDWTFATNDLDVWLVRGDCSFEQFFDGGCTVLASSESATAKPERITAANAAPGLHSMFIGNAGPDDESLSWQVVLTPSGAASGPAGASSVRAGGFERARSRRGLAPK
jgi:hypothetical protein